jgi:hypothetical protein
MTPETVIDRSDVFDQTARHDTGRTVSPSILEHRIAMLKRDLAAERAAHVNTQDQLTVARQRIRAFENMAANFAETLDKADAAFVQLTGRRLEDVAEVRQ